MDAKLHVSHRRRGRDYNWGAGRTHGRCYLEPKLELKLDCKVPFWDEAPSNGRQRETTGDSNGRQVKTHTLEQRETEKLKKIFFMDFFLTYFFRKMIILVSSGKRFPTFLGPYEAALMGRLPCVSRLSPVGLMYGFSPVSRCCLPLSPVGAGFSVTFGASYVGTR